jgi:hypothetical protein
VSGNRLGGAVGQGARVLDLLGLVEGHDTPQAAGQPVGVTAQPRIGGDGDGTKRSLVVIADGAQARCVAGDLARPVRTHRGRADHQVRRLRVAEHQRDGLERLAQPHVIGQHRAAVTVEEPLDAGELITPQRRRQARHRQRVREGQRGAQPVCRGLGGEDVRPVGSERAVPSDRQRHPRVGSAGQQRPGAQGAAVLRAGLAATQPGPSFAQGNFQPANLAGDDLPVLGDGQPHGRDGAGGRVEQRVRGVG